MAQDAAEPSQQELLKRTIDQGLQRMKDNQTHRNRIAQTADWVQWAKGWIDSAVRASPEASAAWASVCVVLPLLTNLAMADEAQREGFAYVTGRMHHYTALGPMLSRLGQNPAVDLELMMAVNSHVVVLYQGVLEFQMQSVRRFYQRSLERNVRDALRPQDWDKMRKKVKDQEGVVNGDLDQINALASRHELESVTKELKSLKVASEENMKKMRLFLLIAEEQLGVTREHLDVGKELRDIEKEHLRVGKELLEVGKQQAQKQLSDKEEKCLQSLRLTTTKKDITYEWYKNRVDNRLDGTCEWFLKHQYFKEWLGRESGVLLVTADPGCGKSVLAKYLIDHVLQRSEAICYFFFKDKDQNTVRQALCAIFHQLFTQRPSLIRYAMAEYKKEGDHLKNVTASLWSILEAAGKDSEAGPVAILLDALDECAESDFKGLIQGLNKHLGGLVKVLATSRPYDQILSKFRGMLDKFPLIRIPGEREDRVISQEVNHVIKHRIGQLATEKELGQDIQDHLERHLLKSQHRTYLWVYLVFKHLEKTNFEQTKKEIIKIVSTLPASVNEAYKKILSKPKDREKLRKALKLILAASRQLTLTEMNIAIKTDLSKAEELELSRPEAFESYIRNLCRLFISIYNGGVYFLH